MAKNANRDEFTSGTKRILEKQSGNHCSNPVCRRVTSAASSDGRTIISIGEASHITAAAPGGPRYDKALTSDQRRAPENGIWLCKDHAKAVDSKDPYFTVELLKSWKQQANDAVWRAVIENAPFPPGPAPPTGDDLRALFQKAAAADLAVFKKSAKWPGSDVSLTLKIERVDEPLNTVMLAKAVTAFEDLILVASPGMGKTATIFQVADGIIENETGSPIIVTLGEWVTTQDGLLSSILKRSAFLGLTDSDFVKAASVSGVVLLLDGWNELDAAARNRVRVEVARLKAELPELGLVVSTRRQALDIPIAGARVDILPLGDEQQMAIARSLRGEAGERLVDQAWRTPGIRELVSIPLYLTSLLALPEDQPFPTTKEEVLRRFVITQEEEAGKRAALATVTGGFHGMYLEALAIAMTADANTSLPDTEARRVVNDVTRQLIADDQLASPLAQPDGLLNILVSAHVLVRGGDAGGYSFQHQQFQEWFASHQVERVMLEAGSDPGACHRLQAELLDRRPWTEGILFASERMSRGDRAQKNACAAAILAAFEVDPLLAAEMIFRVTDDVWSPVKEQIESSVRRWHAPGKLDRAFRFMMTTGRPQFFEMLWPLLTHENDQVHLGALRAAERFRPSLLGDNAAERLTKLPPAVRAHVLHEIAMNSSMDGLDLATGVAKIDPDPEVTMSVADALSFRRADRHLAELLRTGDDALLDQLVKKGHIDEIDDAEVQARLAAARDRLRNSQVSPRERLLLLLNHDDPQSVANEVTALVGELNLARRDDAERHLIWELNRRHSKAFAEGLLNRLRYGEELFYGADDVLAAAGYSVEEDGILKKALAESARGDDTAEAAASVLGPVAVGKMVEAYLVAGAGLRDGIYDKVASERYSALRQRLAHTPGSSLITAVQTIADSAKEEQLSALADLFRRQNDGNADRARPFSQAGLVVIGELAREWAERLLNAADASRAQKAEIASMIAHAPAVDLLPTLQSLLDDNLRRYHDFREVAKASQWRDRASVTEAQHPYMHEYQRALIAIQSSAADDLAARYLTNEHFGECAARVLAVHWSEANEPTSERQFLSGVDFSQVIERRANRRADPGASCMAAEAIFDAVEAMIGEGRTDEQHNRAVVLASIGARLPHGQRDDVLQKLTALAPRRLRASLLLAMVLSGGEVPLSMVEQGIAETLEDAKTQAWILIESNAYQLSEWLRLLPFATPVSGVPEVVALLPDALRNPRMLEEMVRGLGQRSDEACGEVLFRLAEADSRFYQDYQWRKSITALAGEDMVRRLIDLILSGAMNGKLQDDWHWRSEPASLIQEHPAARAYVHDLLKDGPSTKQLALLARTLAENPTAEDVLLLVKAEVATGHSFLNGRSVESAVTTQVPSENWIGAYNVVPVSAAGLRKDLLAITIDGGLRDPAGRCLTEIDKIRDRHGAPESEPRHPDLASGRPWPILTSDPDAENGE